MTPITTARPAHGAAHGRPKSYLIPEYIGFYVDRVVGLVTAGQCGLLLGAPGTGKTHVLRRAKARLERERKGWVQCVEVDAGQAQLTDANLLFQVLNRLRPRDPLLDDIDHSRPDDPTGAFNPTGAESLRAGLHDWMNTQGQDVVLFLDHVEMLTHSADIFATIRAVQQKQLFHAQQSDGAAGRFIAVLASTRSLREVLLSDTSPLKNIVAEVVMEDCPPELRSRHWRKLVAGMPTSAQSDMVEDLDRLCGGDPYLIRKVSEYVARALAGGTASIQRALETLKAQPEQEIDLLKKYGERVENDADILRMVLRILEDKPVPVAEVAARLTVRPSFAWSGIFARGEGGWRFRSELTSIYLRREFFDAPDRVARCLARQQQYRDALQHLAKRRAPERDYVDVLRDVTLAWVQSIDSSDKAWESLADVIRIWFGPRAQLLRYRRERHNVRESPHPYYTAGSREALADTDVASLAHQAYREQAQNLAVASPATRSPLVHEPERLAFYSIIRAGQELGCAILPVQGRLSRAHHAARRDDYRRVFELLDAVADLILDKQRREKPDRLVKLLADVQDMVQEHTALDETDRMLRLVLAAITGGFGLGFNRCVVLQASAGQRLRGRVAIGHTAQAQAHVAWRNITADSFAGVMRQTPSRLQDLPEELRTPLQRLVGQVDFDWSADSLLQDILASGDTLRCCTRAELAQSSLNSVLGVDGDMDGAGNPVAIVPLRGTEGADGRLLGVLVADRPFAGEPVSPGELELLPTFAEQVTRALLNEESQRERQTMREQLENSLTLDAYEMIEAEYGHQWSKRVRGIRNNTHWAIEEIGKLPSPDGVAQIRQYLARVEAICAEALGQVVQGIHAQRINLGQWLRALVEQWNLDNKLRSGLACGIWAFELQGVDEIVTRPAVLKWVILELLGNADAAEEKLEPAQRAIRLSAQREAGVLSYRIGISNRARIPPEQLALMAAGKPVTRADGSGRGIMVSRGQVTRLLGGQLALPEMGAEWTTFTITLPGHLST